MFKKKPTASEIDGVQYRRAKLWQIICYACNGLVGMSVYSLIGMASYSASIGYGITTAAVGIILTCSRILDGITDPLLAFVYDRVNTKFGKLRILLVTGYLIEALALYGMFTGFSSKGLGLPVFALLYIVYIIGYTITNMTAQTIPAIMTNDPRQRPTIGVWTTAFNYLVPMIWSRPAPQRTRPPGRPPMPRRHLSSSRRRWPTHRPRWRPHCSTRTAH